MIWIVKILKRFSIGLVILIILTLAGGRIYQVISASDDLARYPAPGVLVAVDDRMMHINCIGQGSPTVIFELGVGSASTAWSDVHKQVSLFTRACAYDRAGLGYSEPTDQPLRSSNVARRLLDTVWRESEAFNLDINASQLLSLVGDLPLIVLTRGISDTSPQESDTRNELQQELTQLSSNGKQIIATESGHHIYADQPGLLIESIEELVLLVRERRLMQ